MELNGLRGYMVAAFDLIALLVETESVIVVRRW